MKKKTMEDDINIIDLRMKPIYIHLPKFFKLDKENHLK